MLYEQTRSIAQTDVLTGLPNGRALYEQFDQELEKAKGQNISLTVLCFNVSGLRKVNESFGYQAGDAMLAAIANRLREIVAEAGALYRIAGDEFTCLLQCSEDNAIRLGEQVREQIGRMQLEVRPSRFAQGGLNFGTAQFPIDGQSIDELLNAACLATRQNTKAFELEKANLRSRSLSQSQSEATEKSPLALVG